MKKLNISLLIAIILLLSISPLTSLSSHSSPTDESLTILFTHDLHDHMLPYDLLIDNEIVSYGGYGRLATLIDKEKELDPELLLVDAGDFSMGTLFQTIFSSHAPQLKIMGILGYDIVTLGNHEFDFRADGLADSLKNAMKTEESLPYIVASNMDFPKDEKGNYLDTVKNLKKYSEEYGISDYFVFEKNNFKIGVFGVMGEDSISNAPMAEVVFHDEIEVSKNMVKILREKENVDLVICLSHSGTEGVSPKTEDEILAKSVDGIDIIISGHSHTELEKPIIVNDTIIGSCGEYAQNLGKIIIKKNVNNTSWILDEYSLIPIDSKVKEDVKINELVESYMEIVQEEYLDDYHLKFDEVLVKSNFNFIPAREIGKEHQEEPLGNLISDSYIYTVKDIEGEDYEAISLSIVPSGTIRGSFIEGDIDVYDTFVVSSLGIGSDGSPGYPLVSVYLTGKEIKTACEVDASVTPIMTAAQLYMSGLSYTFNTNRIIFNKATNIKFILPDGSLEDIDDNKLYRVVAGLYTGQMLPIVNDKSFGILSLVPKTKEGLAIENFEDHIIKHQIDGKEQELKEWYALAYYLKSFNNIDGDGFIPEYYSQAQERKIKDLDKSILVILKNPNWFSITIYILILSIFLIITITIIKKIKKRRKKKFN